MKALQVFDEFGEGPAQLQQGWATDRQAAQAWLEQLSHSWESKLSPQDQLFKLLRGSSGKAGDKTVKVVNQARQWIGKVFPFAHTPATIGKDNPRKARCTQYLYYRVLHKLLALSIAAESDKRTGSGTSLAAKTQDAVVAAVLEASELQIGLLNCCVEVVNFAYLEEPEETFPAATVTLGRLCHTVELWQAIDWVVDLCGEEDKEGGIAAMPLCLLEYLAAVQTRIEEEIAWVDGSSAFGHMLTAGRCTDVEGKSSSPGRRLHKGSRARAGGGFKDSSPDGTLVARFFTGCVATAMARTAVVCRGLQEQHPELEGVAGFSEKCCKVMDMVLYDELHLMFNQHLSVVIASAIYFVLRLHGLPFAFRKITNYMAASLLNHDEETFAQAEIVPEGGALELWQSGGQASAIGSARQFYNTVFLRSFAAYTASDLFEDCVSGTSQPSPAINRLGLEEDPGAANPAGWEVQGLAQPLSASGLLPLRPLPVGRQQLEAPPSGARMVGAGGAPGSKGRRSGGGSGVAGGIRSKAAGGAGSGRARQRHPLQNVDGNQA